MLRDTKEEESRRNQERIAGIVVKRSQKQKKMAFNFDEKYRWSYFLYHNTLSPQKKRWSKELYIPNKNLEEKHACNCKYHQLSTFSKTETMIKKGTIVKIHP